VNKMKNKQTCDDCGRKNVELIINWCEPEKAYFSTCAAAAECQDQMAINVSVVKVADPF
jgi:hypothetical protein